MGYIIVVLVLACVVMIVFIVHMVRIMRADYKEQENTYKEAMKIVDSINKLKEE